MPGLEECYDQVRQWIGENHKTLAFVVGGFVITWKVIPVLNEKIQSYRRLQALKKWENGPKDVVILHTLSRGKTIPNLSPYAMKLATYLRICKIPYEIDYKVPMSSVGKTPWITLNGEHVADSQLIIKFLNSKFDVKIGNYSEEKRAVGKAVRIMMDEYLYWGIATWRYVHSKGKGLDQISIRSPSALKTFYKSANQRVLKNSYAQGIGRHSEEQITDLMKEALKTASLILGSKPYLLGDEPCEEDCAFFGFIGMVRWGAPGSPYEEYLKNELPNLMEYCDRMKNEFWRDWDQCIAAPKPVI